jgi:hypothetical protein
VLPMASTECGWCGRLAHMNATSAMLLSPNEHGMGSVLQSAYVCPNCHRINIATEHDPDNYVSGFSVASHADADTHRWGRNVQWLPKRGERREFSDVPPQIAEAASEATYCLSMGANRAAGALARAVIEATAKDREAAGKNLADRIDALNLRDFTKDQAHEIRHFGNDMAHGDFADPVTDEEAAEIIELMCAVLDDVYQAPARLAKVRAARLAKREANGQS